MIIHVLHESHLRVPVVSLYYSAVEETVRGKRNLSSVSELKMQIWVGPSHPMKIMEFSCIFLDPVKLMPGHFLRASHGS